MRYAMIMAGGSGTRLWPMSRAELPKQLIPLIEGRSLLKIAYDRIGDLVPRLCLAASLLAWVFGHRRSPRSPAV